MEAIACGTPCVAFNIGGMPDMIEHHSNGYLAQPYQVEDLAQGIAWVIENRERHQKLCDRARQKAEQEFTLEIQARRYQSLFTDILRTIL
jgi:glycosyltransferase involved in cell wall biosynthesis